MITWAYLCTDRRKLALTAAYMRSWYTSIAELDVRWVVCHPEYHPESKEIAGDAIRYRAQHVLGIPDLFPEYNSDRWPKTFFGRDRVENLGTKLSLPAVFAEGTWTLGEGRQLLYTDDDVLVRHNPNDYLKNVTRPMMSYVGTTRYVGNEQDYAEIMRWCKIMRVSMLTVDEYNVARTDGGVAYFGRVDRDEYLDAARAFVDTACELNLQGNRFRMLDQKLWTMWNVAHGGTRFPSDVYKVFATSQPPKKVPNHLFLHYAVGQHKERYMDWLESLAPASV